MKQYDVMTSSGCGDEQVDCGRATSAARREACLDDLREVNHPAVHAQIPEAEQVGSERLEVAASAHRVEELQPHRRAEGKLVSKRQLAPPLEHMPGAVP